MDEILKKINDRAKYIAKKTGDKKCDSNNELIAMGLQIAIGIIQAEQKEAKQRKIKFHQKQLKELLKDESKTKGDVIRESNESLADAIKYVACDICMYNGNINYECQDDSCERGILNYLNQPVEEE